MGIASDSHVQMLIILLAFVDPDIGAPHDGTPIGLRQRHPFQSFSTAVTAKTAMPGRVHRPNKAPIAYKYASLPSSPSRPSPPPSPRFRFRNVLVPTRSSREGLGIDLPNVNGIVSGTGVAVKVGEGIDGHVEHRTDFEALKGTLNDPRERGDRFGSTAAIGGVGAPAVTWGHGDDQVFSESHPDMMGRRAERVKGLFRGMMGGPTKGDPIATVTRVKDEPIKRPTIEQAESTQPLDDDSLDGYELERRIRELLRRGSEHQQRVGVESGIGTTVPGTPRRGSMNVKALEALLFRRNSSFESSSFTQSSGYTPSPVVATGKQSLPVMTGDENGKGQGNGKEKDKVKSTPIPVMRADTAVNTPGYADQASSHYAEAFFSARDLPATPKHDPAELAASIADEEARLEKRLAELKIQKAGKVTIAIGEASQDKKREKSPVKPDIAESSGKEDDKGSPLATMKDYFMTQDPRGSNALNEGVGPRSRPIQIHPNAEQKRLVDSPVMMADAELDGGEEESTAFDDALHAAKGCVTMLQYLRTRKTSEKYAESTEKTLTKQVRWMEENLDSLQGKPLQSLETLHRMYNKGEVLCNDPAFASSSSRPKKLHTLVAEGVPYLTLLALFEGTVYAAEMISVDLADELDEIFQDLAQNRAGPEDFEAAAGKVKQVLQNTPRQDLSDGQARQAWKEIVALQELIKEKVSELAGPAPVKESKTEKIKSILKPKKFAPKAEPAPKAKSTSSKPSSAKNVVPESKSDSKSDKKLEDKKPLPRGVSDSYVAFKDGGPGLPVPSPDEPEPEPLLYNYNGQVVTRSAMSLLDKEDKMARRGGLFERDGVIMTASALSLLQAQEMMERADTSGQGEWGPDTWDPIRGQYIPKWAKKLTTADRWPLVDDEGHRLRDEKGDPEVDWFDPNLEALEAKNLLQFGMEGVVDYPY